MCIRDRYIAILCICKDRPVSLAVSLALRLGPGGGHDGWAGAAGLRTTADRAPAQRGADVTVDSRQWRRVVKLDPARPLSAERLATVCSWGADAVVAVARLAEHLLRLPLFYLESQNLGLRGA